MSDKNIPDVFRLLLMEMSIEKEGIVGTTDGFTVFNKSIANLRT